VPTQQADMRAGIVKLLAQNSESEKGRKKMGVFRSWLTPNGFRPRPNCACMLRVKVSQLPKVRQLLIWTTNALSALVTKHSRNFISRRRGAAAYEDQLETTESTDNDASFARSRPRQSRSASQFAFARLTTMLRTCNGRVHRLVLFRTSSGIQ
jgi:hypothetical protein